MPRLPPQTLNPIEPEGQTSVIDTYSTQGATAFLTFNVGVWDWLQVSLTQVGANAWTATAVVSVQWSLDGSTFFAFTTPITFGDATTPHDRFRVTGLLQVRVAVTTPAGSAGDAKFRVYVRGSQSP